MYCKISKSRFSSVMRSAPTMCFLIRSVMSAHLAVFIFPFPGIWKSLSSLIFSFWSGFNFGL